MAPPEIRRHEEQKLAGMRDSVAARLKRVCVGMDDREFQELVDQIAHFKIKWGDSLIYDNPPALGAWMFGEEKGDNKK